MDDRIAWRLRWRVPLFVLCMLVPEICLGHSVKQRGGGYRDSDGAAQSRIAADLVYDGGKAGRMSASSYSLTLQSDLFKPAELDEVQDERRLNTISAGTSHSIDRITDLRTGASYASDGKSSNRSFSVGISQWILHETVRISVDVARTETTQQPFSILDYDSTLIEVPSDGVTRTASLGVRHLATPTTITDYIVTQSLQNGRPPAHAGTFGVRQYVPWTDSAIHVNATRAINKGSISTETTYGEVDSWTAEGSYLQNLWKGALSRIFYRYYKETEVTRAYEDVKVFGADAYGAALTQEFPKNAVTDAPVTLEAGGSRYLTNTNIAATAFQVGLSTLF